MRRIPKALLYGLSALAVAILLLLATVVVVLQTPWFRGKVRERIVYEIGKATGARAEIGQLDYNLKNGTARVRDLVIHGKERPDEPPLARMGSIELGLTVKSFIHRQINLGSLVIKQPEFHVIIYRDGTTNIPGPQPPRRPGPNVVERLIDLAIGRFTVESGLLSLDDQKIPLSIDAQDLRAQFDFDRALSVYSGRLTFGKVYVTPPGFAKLPLNVDASLKLERNRVDIANARISLEDSAVHLSGALVDLRKPQLELRYIARIALKEVAPLVRASEFTAGDVTVTGELVNRSGLWGSFFSGMTSRGTLRAAGIAFHSGPFRMDRINAVSELAATLRLLELTRLRGSGRVVRIAPEPPVAKLRNFPARLTGNVEISRDGLQVRNLVAQALGGSAMGAVDLASFRNLRVDVATSGFSLREITERAGLTRAVWDGMISGPVRVTGTIVRGAVPGLKADARLSIAPAPGENPVSGSLHLAYDRRAGTLELGRSFLGLHSSRAEFSGVLGRSLEVTVESSNLTDFDGVLALATSGAPPRLPVALQNGHARFRGTVTGPLSDPRVEGRLALARFVYEGRLLDTLQATVGVSGTGVHAQDLTLRKGQMSLKGAVEAGLRKWQPAPDLPVSGHVSLEAPDLAPLLAEVGQNLPARGKLSADLTLAGTLNAPQLTARAALVDGALYGQPLDRMQADIRYANNLAELRPAVIQIGPNQVRVTMAFEHQKDDWRSGTLRFEAAGDAALPDLEAVKRSGSGLQGQGKIQFGGEIQFSRSAFRIGFLNGQLALSGLSIKENPLGNLVLAAVTKGENLDVSLTGTLAEASVRGTSQWLLEKKYPVKGRLDFTRVDLSRLLAIAGRPQLPFEGFAAGGVTFSGSMLEPPSWRAAVDLTTLEITPRLAALGVSPPAGTRLTNDGPIQFEVTAKSVRIQRALLSGKDTSIRGSGSFNFGSRNPWDVRLQGSMNLAVLKNFEPNLTSSGNLTIDTTFRGPLARPEIFGRAEVDNGSVYFGQFPNGLDRINAVLLLFRDRATIERFSAESGGGKVSATGFLGFGEPFTYYLQARGEEVRYRTRDGISAAANMVLNFTGTSERSVLAGEVTITRVSFTPHTDLARLLGQATQPMPTIAAPSRFTQGVRFDIQVRTAPQARFETALARGLQAEADLRLRGDPIRPLLLGRVLINQGEILFFGNKYTIDSGEIVFVDPTKILPLVNLALQTKVRGIDVTFTITGPINKLNVTYRSDPPLPVSDVISLLATGQAPASAPGLVGAQTAQSMNWEQAGATALLSQALANPLAGRLQRFFGISNLKIAPSISGVTNTPEARVTLEQQITPDLTFTYITNLTRTQEQSIQVEWDLTKSWSAIATREENGVFGIDFLYKRTFK